MMEALKKWVIAELKASSLPGLPKVISASINDLPSEAGIFVAMGSQGVADRQHTENQEFRIISVTEGEQSNLTLVRLITIMFYFVPGQLKSWTVAPAAMNLSIKDIQRISIVAPESFGAANRYFQSTIVFSARGRDTR